MEIRRLRDLPIVSTALVVINVIVFLLCTFSGDLLYNMWGLSVQGVLGNGEYGRIVGALFLHSNINHIFNNMVILFFLGAMIEKEVGHLRYIIIYFLAGIGGNILSLIYKLMTHEMIMSVGASGAVFGLDGVLLALILFSGKKLSNITPVRVLLMIGYSLYSGFTEVNVDNAAHIGGLFVGFLAGIIICILDGLKRTRNKVRGNIRNRKV